MTPAPSPAAGRRLGLALAAVALLALPLSRAPQGHGLHAEGGLAYAADAAPAPPACRPHPHPGRDLFLRGTHNRWASDEPHRFTWLCNRFELVAHLRGEQAVKVGDDAWSADADFGGRPAGPDGRPVADFAGGRPVPLVPAGTAFVHRFAGTHRFVLSMASNPPTLSISACDTPPLGDAQLFLRGSMNNWAALDEYAFRFSCDAYYLNVKLDGRFDFRIGEPEWRDATSFGAATPSGGAEPRSDRPEPLGAGRGAGNLAFRFSGEQTLRLAFPGGKPMLTIGPKSYADPTAARVDDPVALSLAHDSRAEADKAPFGAVPAGTTVHFGVGALPGVERLTLVVERRRLEGNQDVLAYTEVARVPMTRSADPDRPGRERWTARHRFDAVAVHGYWFEARIGGQDFALQNNRHAVHWTRERGANGPAEVGEKPAQTRTLRRLRLTVYDPAFRVPDYAPDIVYYYIFPERFRNGDPSNDPRPGRDTYQDKPIERHARWTDPPFRPGSGDGSDAVFNNDFFGGDLAGIIEKT
jgi:cyclomaltodextrinase